MLESFRLVIIMLARHCCMCGISLPRGCKRRFQGVEDSVAFVARRCKATPFLFTHLSGSRAGARREEGVCIPCVNWKRRVQTEGLKRTRRPMLQLDQLICFLLRPGEHQEPDHRCMERLVRAARDPTNPYRCVFPLPVRAILDAASDDSTHACILAWWEYNGRSEFFASSQEARRVRMAIKARGLSA